MQDKLNKYLIFLNSLNTIIDKYFEEQKDFIKCKKGCSHCCKDDQFPVSEIEFEFIKQGLNNFDPAKKEILLKRIRVLYKERRKFLNAGNDIFDYYYDCPFLFDGECSIYDYRPIVCRTSGLISKELNEGVKRLEFPVCTRKGLNYSDVWDPHSKSFRKDKMAELGITSRPKAYNLLYSALLQKFEDSYGDIRMLFEWVLINIPGYEKIIEEIVKEIEQESAGI